MRQSEYDRNQNALPVLDRDLDSGPFLPRPEKVGQGALVHLRGWTVLSWWGSPWDRRPNVNAAIIAEGIHPVDGVWEFFEARFPAPAKHLTRPIVAPEHDGWYVARSIGAELLRRALKDDAVVDAARAVMQVGMEAGDDGREILRRGLASLVADTLAPETMALIERRHSGATPH